MAWFATEVGFESDLIAASVPTRERRAKTLDFAGFQTNRTDAGRPPAQSKDCTCAGGGAVLRLHPPEPGWQAPPEGGKDKGLGKPTKALTVA